MNTSNNQLWVVACCFNEEAGITNFIEAVLASTVNPSFFLHSAKLTRRQRRAHLAKAAVVAGRRRAQKKRRSVVKKTVPVVGQLLIMYSYPVRRSQLE